MRWTGGIEDSEQEGLSQDGTGRSTLALELARGVSRTLAHHGYATLTEFTLRTGRRVDVIGLDGKGKVVIVEIKSSVEDFRSDGKWPEYLEFCDSFYFAVPESFPQDLIPGDLGLMVGDAYGAAVLRESEDYGMNGSRRRALLLQFALAAGRRLRGWEDPSL